MKGLGGSILALGAATCVFKPPLKCKDSSKQDATEKAFRGSSYVSRLIQANTARKEVDVEDQIKNRIDSLPSKVQKYVLDRVVLHKTFCEATITHEDNQPEKKSKACFPKGAPIESNQIALQTPEFVESLDKFVTKLNEMSRTEFSKEQFQDVIRRKISDVLKTLAYLNVNQSKVIIHSDLHIGNVGLKKEGHAAIADWGESYFLDISKTIRENGLSKYKFFPIRNGVPGDPLTDDKYYDSASTFNMEYPQHSFARAVWFQIVTMIRYGTRERLYLLTQYAMKNPLCKKLSDEWNAQASRKIDLAQFLDNVSATVHQIEKFNDVGGFLNSFISRIRFKYSDWVTEIETSLSPIQKAYMDGTLTFDFILNFPFLSGDEKLISKSASRSKSNNLSYVSSITSSITSSRSNSANAKSVARKEAEAKSIARKEAEAKSIARKEAEAKSIARKDAEAKSIARKDAEAKSIARKEAKAKSIARKEAESLRRKIASREKKEAEEKERQRILRFASREVAFTKNQIGLQPKTFQRDENIKTDLTTSDFTKTRELQRSRPGTFKRESQNSILFRTNPLDILNQTVSLRV